MWFEEISSRFFSRKLKRVGRTAAAAAAAAAAETAAAAAVETGQKQQFPLLPGVT